VRIAFSQLKWIEHRTGIRNPQLRQKPSSPLHLEAYVTALRVLALAGKFGCLLRIGTCIAAVTLSGRSRTVASSVFAFIRRGHKGSLYLNMPSPF
jgi:hypothetical protein